MKLIYRLLIAIVIVFIWSVINPFDIFTWFLEVLPAIIGLLILIVTFKNFRFSNLIYVLIFFHCTILIVGGHYTYAEVPLFEWIQDTFNQSRNNYDKLGHFAQGFVPAMIIREVLIRKSILNNLKWLNFITVCIALAISAVYEFIEWGIALASGENGTSFLGTQGYIWDTQSDMLYALIGAVFALITLSQYHNKQLNRIIIDRNRT